MLLTLDELERDLTPEDLELRLAEEFRKVPRELPELKVEDERRAFIFFGFLTR